METKSNKETYYVLDLVRFISAFLIILIHTHPFEDINNTLDDILINTFCRMGVPFFFMITGFFIEQKIKKDGLNIKLFLNTSKRMLWLCFIWALIYLPVFLINASPNGTLQEQLERFIKVTFIDCVGYHLWYLLSCSIGVMLLYWFKRKFINQNIPLVVTIIIYLIGCCLNADFSRNGLFFALPFLFLGTWIYNNRSLMKTSYLILLSCLFGFIHAFEVMFVVQNFAEINNGDLWICLYPLAYLLFNLFLRIQLKESKSWIKLRNISKMIYYSHMYFVLIYMLFTEEILGFLGVPFVRLKTDVLIFTLINTVLFSVIYVYLSDEKFPTLKKLM